MTTETDTQLIERWIAAANSHDARQFLSFFTDDAALDDPSVGEKFHGKAGIKRYYDDYFIGYSTETQIVGTSVESGRLHVDSHFTGDFPGGETGGTFDITVRDGRISFILADLTG